MSATSPPALFPAERANSRNAVIAGFLGWTLDAFDFFILTYVLTQIAAEFHKSVAEMTLTITASLVMRPVGAILFGLMADRYGRRIPLMVDVIFYSVVEVLSGFAPSYRVFLILRLLYGIGMGGEWGVGASLAMESVPVKWRGILIRGAAGRLRTRQSAGGRGVLDCVPALGLASDVLHRRLARAADAFHPRQSKRERSMEGHRRKENKLERVFSRGCLKLEALRLSGRTDHDNEFHVARNARPVPDAAPEAAPFQHARHGHRQRDFDDRRNRRRNSGGTILGPLRQTPRDGDIRVAWGCYWYPCGLSRRGMVLIATGAFLMQFMVQGAWGVVPVHLNELSPGPLRGFFPGFAYQLGVLIAAGASNFEALMTRQNLTYAEAMGMVAAIAFLAGAVVIAAGPEAHRVPFGPSGG